MASLVSPQLADVLHGWPAERRKEKQSLPIPIPTRPRAYWIVDNNYRVLSSNVLCGESRVAVKIHMHRISKIVPNSSR
jgi:hypothetical protein